MKAFIIMKEDKSLAINDKVASITVKPVVVFDSMQHVTSWLHTMRYHYFKDKFIRVIDYTDNILTIRLPCSVIRYYVVVTDYICKGE